MSLIIKTQSKLDVFFKLAIGTDAYAPSAAAEARASLSKRAFDRDVQLAGFKREAIGLLAQCWASRCTRAAGGRYLPMSASGSCCTKLLASTRPTLRGAGSTMTTSLSGAS